MKAQTYGTQCSGHTFTVPVFENKAAWGPSYYGSSLQTLQVFYEFVGVVASAMCLTTTKGSVSNTDNLLNSNK